MIAAYAFLLVYGLWLFYLAVMALKRARDAGTLSKVAYAMGLPILLVGYALDVACNLTVMSVLFLELPREGLVTSRLTRHINTSSGWRERLAAWFCGTLLNAFDPSGKHC